MTTSHHFRRLLAALIALIALSVPVAAQEATYELTLLHTNDVHARVLEFDGFGGTCDADASAAGECFGGVARRATKIDEIRSAEPNVLLVDGGDQFQGTLFYNKYKGEEAQRFMNALGYQGMAVGNHEFDDGPGNLGSFIRGANFPVVSSNIDVSSEPELDGWIKPWAVVNIGGEQIGLVGFTTEDTQILSSPGPTVQFNPIEPAVEEAIKALEAMGINKIVALSHSGFGRDKVVAANVDGIDVLVSGHTNTFLSNTDEDAEGPYPTVVNSPNGDPVLVVSAFAWGMYLGRLDVGFDAAGVPVSWDGEPILLDASIPQDPEILADAMSFNNPLEALRSEVIGTATVMLDGDRSSCRFGECTMGNLITDAMLWNTAPQGVQIAVTNGGGIRASIAQGSVSTGDVLEVLPFGNSIATFGISGADLLAALENGVSRADSAENEGTGRFLQVAGMRYVWNPELPAGARILSAEVQAADGSYSPLDLGATYQVATNNFVRTGGDGYSVFAEKAINPYDFGPTLDEVVADYITAFSPVEPKIEGRITVGSSGVGLQGDVPAAAPPADETDEEAASEADADDAGAPGMLPVTGSPLTAPLVLALLAGLTLLLGGAVLRRRAL